MMKKTHRTRPEVWGGIECSISRTHNNYKDQLLLSGHYNRRGDISQFASLGIQAIRYPVLWEKHCLTRNGVIDWSWTSGQLTRLKELNVRPIAGLLHHGSGPAYTSLADPEFPKKLAEFAGKVAEEFPWLEYYTPVNEPLTTARFSGLYGLWFPHHKSNNAFLTMLLNQVEGIILSMRAIRKINPSAKLVQTEDIGKTHSTRKLRYQANFENHRRWLTYDLLCGKVNDSHPLWNYFLENDITERRLNFFLENPCVPDIAGFNYYVTSERYLDERLEKFPECCQGTNGRHIYADTEAARCVRTHGIRRLLREAWKRYKLPLAVTEAHLHCSREDQVRWFSQIWDSCIDLMREGITIKAVTAWALLGAYDWDKLLTSDVNNYEAGVFDVSKGSLRPTAVANVIRTLVAKGRYNHPLVQNPGWWHCHNPALMHKSQKQQFSKLRPLLIIGKNGTLGNAFKIICGHRGIEHVILSRQEMDITRPDAVRETFKAIRPWGVINASGYVRVDSAETEVDACVAANITGPRLLAGECNIHNIPLMHFSADMVFDGNKRSPYFESDAVFPINIYGKTKMEGELAIREIKEDALVIRSSAFFGPWDTYNFVYQVLESIGRSEYCHVAKDVYISPTYVPDLVNASLDLFIDGATGTWHISNDGATSWSDFAEQIIGKSGQSVKKILAVSSAEMNWKADRPCYSVLGSERGLSLPCLPDALDRYFKEKKVL